MNTSMDKFHVECLVGWDRLSCPVCHLTKNPDLLKNCDCMDCGSNKLTWYCLICGHIGCSDKEGRHALDHFEQTKHEFVVELKEFKVWDHEKEIWLHDLNEGENQEFAVFPKSTNIKHKPIKCSCPVCHYKKIPRLQKQYSCMKCDNHRTQFLWVCLTCGHVACDRESNHALKHYETSHHPLLMRVRDFTVWHYENNKFEDMKLHIPELEEFENVDDTDNPESCASSGTSAKFGSAKELLASDFTPDYAKAVQQQEVLLKRLVSLERKWQDFDYLTANETNKKINNIEHCLQDLTDKTKSLNKKIGEQDIRLDELLTKLNELNGELKRSTQTNSTTNHDAASSSTVPSAEDDKQDKIATAILIGLAVCCTLRFLLKIQNQNSTRTPMGRLRMATEYQFRCYM